MTVYILNIGCITPFCSGDLYNKENLPPPMEISLEDYGGKGKGLIINKEYLNKIDLPSKGLMSYQTRLAFIAYRNTNILKFLGNMKSYRGLIYIANGHISLEDETIDIIKKYALDKDNNFDFRLLGQNIDKMPPLDGIKMLSTAISHFIAKDLEINDPGHQIYIGDNNSSAAIVEAYFKLKDMECDFALVVSSETPFFKHSYPYRNLALKKDIEKIGEGSYACVLIGDKIMKDLNKQKKIENLYQIKFADNKLYTQDINPKVEKNLIYYGSADGLSKIYSSLSYKEFNSNIFNDRNGEGSISSIHIERAVL
ncbi:MAG: hypothetical protein H6910_04295 [Rickettsiaceae bacterium]|nr:hypothetical protein [Rickettsiaceae bacterium]MCP5375094.1 hypothetical protein [Rickettsiaceae bacterium]MCP5378317.1 hypothetical protein [Rickettsiaceae bacterium]